MEQAAEGLRIYCEAVNNDPYYKLFIKPMIEERIRYSKTLRGKLIPWSPYDRYKRKVQVMEILFTGFMLLILIIVFR